jgi:hypothetical protein
MKMVPLVPNTVAEVAEVVQTLVAVYKMVVGVVVPYLVPVEVGVVLVTGLVLILVEEEELGVAIR